MVDEGPNPSSSSDVSLLTDTPPALHSRQRPFRRTLRHRATRLHNLNLIWHRRHYQSLRDAGFSPTSTDEEDETAVYTASVTTLNAALTALNARTSNPSRSSVLRGKPVRNALQHLPRPSEAVKYIDEGSASDFGLGNEIKKAHRRRVSATVVGVQYLNKKGDQDPVPRWTLERSGLKKYTAYLQPPKEDRYIRHPLTDKALLSRHYRGSFLTLYRLGDKRKVRKKLVLPTSSSESGACADCECWPTTSDSDVAPVVKWGNARTSQRVQKFAAGKDDGSKAALVQQVLAEIDSHSSDSEDQEDNSSSDKVRPASAAVEEISTAKRELNFMDEIMNVLESNPDALTQVAKLPPSKTQASKPEEKKSKEDNEVKEKGVHRQNDIKPAKPLSKFDREKKKGIIFCQKKRSAKTMGGDAFLFSHLEPQWQKRKVNGDVEALDPFDLTTSGTANYGNASRMMQKMGFTGRLGAKEDGVTEFIEAKRNAGRSGLGSMPQWRQAVEGSRSDTEKNVKEVSGKGATPSMISEGAAAEVSHITNRVVAEAEVLDDLVNGRVDENADNGRRAILIDVDALLKNSRKRRIKAFQRMVEVQDSSRGGSALEKLCHDENKDLCDADCIWKIMELEKMERSDEVHKSLQETLDEAFRDGDGVEVNFELVQLLQGYSRKVHFGLFHRGSEKRSKVEVGCVSDVLKSEHGAMGLPDVFLRAPRVTVTKGEEWPYTASWQELLCRVGVQAAQGMFIVGESVAGDAMSCGVAAGIVLGTRTLAIKGCEGEGRMRTSEGGGKCVEMSIGKVVGADVRGMFETFLRERKKREQRRKVIGLYSGDALWYCGREEIGPGDGVGSDIGQSMIRFYRLDRVEWVENENVVGLAEKKFESLRKNGFPGLLEPADVEDY